MDQLRGPTERLGFDMFRAASEIIEEQTGEEKSFVVGAFAAAAAAALIYVGSGGETADKLKRVMRFERLFESRCTPQLIMIAFRQAVAHITKRPDHHFPLDEAVQKSAFQVVLANKAYFKHGNEVRSEFFNNARHVFNTDIAEMEGTSAPGDLETMRKEINEWVCENTEGHVREMLPPLTLVRTKDWLTRMILISVTFMRARWSSAFRPREISNGTFKNIHGKKRTVPMMRGVLHLPFSEDKENRVKYVELPYANNEACLCLMIPTPHRGHRKSLKDMLKSFKFDTFARIAVQKTLRKVDFMVPKFRIDNTFDMKDIFARIGMESAFNKKADYSNMVKEDGEFHLSGAFLKCAFDVNEHGTCADFFEECTDGEEEELPPGGDPVIENYRRSSVPEVVEFHADTPFIFSVRHNLSGLILFVGRVSDFPESPEAKPRRRASSWGRHLFPGGHRQPNSGSTSRLDRPRCDSAASVI